MTTTELPIVVAENNTAGNNVYMPWRCKEELIFIFASATSYTRMLATIGLARGQRRGNWHDSVDRIRNDFWAFPTNNYFNFETK
jgi:hypothetical protein